MTLFSLVALSDPRGRLLMQERDDQAPIWPLMWGLPGGACEAGESPLETALRELEEETGLSGIELTEVAVTRHFHPSIGWYEFASFGGVADVSDADIDCREGKQIVFRDVADIWGLDLTPATARVLPDIVRRAPYATVHGPAALPERHRFAGVILVDRDGRILLQERDEHPRIDPEKWGLAGGHLDPGEEFEQAAYRELAEETGIRAEPGSLQLWGDFVVDHRHAYGTWDQMQVYVAGSDLTDADIRCGEGRQIVFVDPVVARGLPLTHAGADVVPAFLESDLYRTLKERP